MRLRFTLLACWLLVGIVPAWAQSNLWGTTSAGVADNKGVIFKTNADGTVYTVQYNFITDFPGTSPQNMLTEANGKLYGMTNAGGANDQGIIFEYDPSNDTYANKYDFSAATSGAYPQGGFVLAANGFLYGMTTFGGVNGKGVLFEYDPVGNVFTKKFDFSLSNGANPQGSLIEASNGKLYGVTRAGGANGDGVLFEYDPLTSTYLKKVDFASVSTGKLPLSDLVEAANGNLYGMASFGGANNLGVLFEFDTGTGTLTKKVDFAGADGAYPNGNLAVALNGKLYGMTSGGGSSGQGVLFEYVAGGSAVTKKLDFSGSNGANPQGGLARASGGLLYGMTANGGSNSVGVLFDYAEGATSVTKRLDFSSSSSGSNPQSNLVQATNGKLYGMTPYGGPAGNGVLFEYDPAGSTYTKKVDFSNSSNGSNPQGGIIQAPNGMLYGMTANGGDNAQGVLYEYDPTGNIYTKKLDFSISTNGAYPSGSLVLAPNGKLYGMTPYGGANGDGVLFEYDPGSISITKKIDFLSSTSGSTPQGSLVLATNGKLYGMTSNGGPNGNGVLFEFDPATSSFVIKSNFSITADGTNPKGSLIVAANGKLYGMTNQGGSSGIGAIFEVNASGNAYTKKVDFASSNGAYPSGDLVQASNGKLYGMTSGGGANSDGVIFEYDPTAVVPAATVKFSFMSSSSGSSPAGSLTEVASGKLYGMTASGGAQSSGVLFQFDLSNDTFINRLDFGGSNGSFPQFESLLLVPGKQAQSITFNALPNKMIGDAPFPLTATASSGLGVTYTSSDPTIASISGSTVTILGFGTVTITASQGGDVNYAFAQNVNQPLTIGRTSQTITFGALAAKTFGDIPFTLSATATSGLPVSFASSDPATASISGNTVTIVKAGTVTITASQPGNSSYDPAPDVPQALVINKANQTISFAPPAPVTFGQSSPPALVATVNSPLPITFTPSPALISITGNTYTILQAGLVTITASQAGNGNYNAAPDAQNVLTINKADQAITFNALAPVTFGVAPFALTGTTTSSLPLTYTSSDPTVAGISGNTVTVLKAGSAMITAVQPGNVNYNAAPGVPSQLLTVNQASQTITFAPIPDKSIASGSFTLSATASSGLAVSYVSSNPAVATVSGNTVMIVALGTTTITASQAGNVNYSAAPTVPQSFNVIPKQSQTITFGALAIKNIGDPPFGLAATASSGLTVGYTSSDPSVATVSGNAVTIVGPGSATITASQPGDVNYNAAVPVNQTLTVNKANQTITFPTIPIKSIASPPFTLSASASSGLAVSYVSSDPSVATVSGSTVTIVGAGSTTITASQPGDVNFNAAVSVNQLLTVNKTNQTITFSAIPVKSIASLPFTISATASSGLTVSYVSNDLTVATVSGNTVTIVGLGSTTITASQAGNATYNAAPSVNQPLIVIAKQAQSITFGAIPNKILGDPPFILTAVATSGLPVSFTSSNTSVATISGNTLTIAGLGNSTITASQAGDVYFNPAFSVSQVLSVLVTGDLPDLSVKQLLYPNPARDKVFVDLYDFLPSPVDLKIMDLTGRNVHQQSATGGGLVEINIADHAVGMYILMVTQGSKTLEVKYLKN